jgi:hypothetical protein
MQYFLGGNILFGFFTSAIAGFANKFANSGFDSRHAASHRGLGTPRTTHERPRGRSVLLRYGRVQVHQSTEEREDAAADVGEHHVPRPRRA